MQRKSITRRRLESIAGALILIGSLIALKANAALKLESQTTKAVFLNSDGKQISPIEATTLSIEGKKVLKCQEVEAVASDKGNISLKNKK